MPDGGVLSIRTTFEESSERVQVVIADTGRGIEPSVVEHLFEKFVSTKAMGEGTGLGLGIVKEILTGHRGTIQISPASSAGTEVHITLPADTGVGVLRDRTVMEAERRV
jgi:signal transduction histidine kinase